MVLKYLHVNVFSKTPLSGNGLVVFYDCPKNLTAEQMLNVTKEMRQFESIFLFKVSQNKFTARIFTVDEELDFAGHPILGAASALHYIHLKESSHTAWEFVLSERVVIIQTTFENRYFHATMDQGKPQFSAVVPRNKIHKILQLLNLTVEDIHPALPLEVVSTGLPHLIVPLTKGIEQAKIISTELEAALSIYGAKFVYIFDVARQEGRTWDNFGHVEDIATGSAAGPAGAYLFHHGLVDNNKPIVINQGRFVKRPSEIHVDIIGDKENIRSVKVSGSVTIFAQGNVFLNNG